MLKQKQLISKASSWIHWFIYYVKIQVVILHLWTNIWNNSKRAFYILALIHKFCVTGRTFLIAASAFGANVFLSVFACNTNIPFAKCHFNDCQSHSFIAKGKRPGKVSNPFGSVHHKNMNPRGQRWVASLNPSTSWVRPSAWESQLSVIVEGDNRAQCVSHHATVWTWHSSHVVWRKW